MLSTKPQKRSSKKRRVALIVALILLALLLSYTIYAKQTDNWPFTAPQTEQATSDDTVTDSEDSINYDPPTKEDTEASQDGKKDIPATDPSNPGDTAPEDKKTVAIGVSFAEVYQGNVEIRAFIPSVIEGNGACNATLTNGSQTVKASSPGFIDSRSTQCEPIYIPVSKFPTKGTWKLVVTYTSPTSAGASESMEVKL
jgi:cytoskeletal protein RodZ